MNDLTQERMSFPICGVGHGVSASGTHHQDAAEALAGSNYQEPRTA